MIQPKRKCVGQGKDKKSQEKRRLWICGQTYLFENQSIINLRVMTVPDIKLQSRLSKNINLSRDF